MTALRVAIGLIWLLCLLAGRGFWLREAASPFAATSAEITDPTFLRSAGVIVAPPMESRRPTGTPELQLDLFGNEIEDALADYRFDVRGSLYERHSPETALQKLGSPTT